MKGGYGGCFGLVALISSLLVHDVAAYEGPVWFEPAVIAIGAIELPQDADLAGGFRKSRIVVQVNVVDPGPDVNCLAPCLDRVEGFYREINERLGFPGTGERVCAVDDFRFNGKRFNGFFWELYT
jgi:hypothetical protein